MSPRVTFLTAFLGLLGVFNLLALAAISFGLWDETPEAAGLYFGVSVSCFGVLLIRSLRRRRT